MKRKKERMPNMKKTIIGVIAVTAALVAIRQIARQTPEQEPEQRIPYYDYR
jgi:hypothetical protein